MSTIQSDRGASVGFGGRAPIQGFDITVTVLEQETGKQALIGDFTSYQWTVRNATEPYLTFNQRNPDPLDGELQYGWVLEQGLVDTRVILATFGTNIMIPEQRMSRSPRFVIVIDAFAPELEEGDSSPYSSNELDRTALFTGGNPNIRSAMRYGSRKAIGQIRLLNAKVDSYTQGGMAGRSVVASRWEGLCSGIQEVTEGDTLLSEEVAGVNGANQLDLLSSSQRFYSGYESFLNNREGPGS